MNLTFRLEQRPNQAGHLLWWMVYDSGVQKRPSEDVIALWVALQAAKAKQPQKVGAK